MQTYKAIIPTDNIIKEINNIIVLKDKFPINKKLISPIKNIIIPTININVSGIVENDIIPSNEYLVNLIKLHLDVPYFLFSGIYGT